MKTLIFSDVHGNLPALELILKMENDLESFVFLGDAVNYGPWSNECVQLIDQLPNSLLIKGNHDEYFENGFCDVDNDMVQAFFDKTYSDFDQHLKFEKYVLEGQFINYCTIHTVNNRYVFEDTELIIDKNYLIGHSHYQFKKEVNGYTLINVGSVGQNRKFIDQVNYAIYDYTSDSINLKGVTYDIDILINEMISRNYPQACIDYYLNKPRLV